MCKVKRLFAIANTLFLCLAVSGQEMDFEYFKNHIYLKADVNDRRANMVFDTGATEAVILDSTFIVQKGLEFKQIGKARVGGAGTGQQITRIIIGEVTMTLGGRKYTPQMTPILRLRAILGDQADGIIGMDAFKGKVLSWDYRSGKISVMDKLTLGATEGYTKVPYEVWDKAYRILVPIEVKVDDKTTITGKGIMDVGSGQGIDFTSPTAKKNNLARLEGKQAFHQDIGGVGGQSSGYKIPVSSIIIGGLPVKLDTASFSNDSKGAFASADYAAIIGNKVWEQFSIILDLKNKVLYIKR